MLSYHHHRSVMTESRNDDEHLISRETESLKDVTRTECDEPESREKILKTAITEAQEDINDAKAVARRLKSKLILAQIKLGQVKRAARKAKDDHSSKMYDILFNQIPGYRNAIPPIDYSVVEADDQVGPYKMYECIGEGSFAEVYRCKHEQSGSIHAIKCIDKRQFRSLKEIAQLGHEIEVLRSGLHDNIMTCTDVIHAADHIYLVMNLCSIDLFMYLAKYKMSMTESARRIIMRGILRGVENLHHVGVVHRDLKSENILIARDVPPHMLTRKDIKICDFGLCQISEVQYEDVEIRSFVGTPGFISPELTLLSRSKVLEPRAFVAGPPNDMWAVGVILMELTGKMPKGWIRICKLLNHPDAFEIEMKETLIDLHDLPLCEPNSSLHLLRQLVRWDPTSRWSAIEALSHPWVKGVGATTAAIGEMC